ncbi:hypothetical protein Tco_0785987 [Tanacetum coccineum]
MSSDTNCWILDVITQLNGIRVPYLLISHPVRKYSSIYLEILILGDKSHGTQNTAILAVSGRVFLVDGEPKLLHIYLWNICSDEDSGIAGEGVVGGGVSGVGGGWYEEAVGEFWWEVGAGEGGGEMVGGGGL